MNRDQFIRSLNSTLETVVYYMKVGLAFIALVLFVALMGAVFAVSTPTHTFTDDGFTVAQSADGVNMTILYKVDATYEGQQDVEMRADAMSDMREASVCANGRIDNYIESHNRSEIRSKKLNELANSCTASHVEIEVTQYRYTYTESDPSE